MVCMVKVNGTNGLVPACGTIVGDGMRVESDSDEVYEARKAALEALNAATSEFASRRMDRNIRKALAGHKVDEIEV